MEKKNSIQKCTLYCGNSKQSKVTAESKPFIDEDHKKQQLVFSWDPADTLNILPI